MLVEHYKGARAVTLKNRKSFQAVIVFLVWRKVNADASYVTKAQAVLVTVIVKSGPDLSQHPPKTPMGHTCGTHMVVLAQSLPAAASHTRTHTAMHLAFLSS